MSFLVKIKSCGQLVHMWTGEWWQSYPVFRRGLDNKTQKRTAETGESQKSQGDATLHCFKKLPVSITNLSRQEPHFPPPCPHDVSYRRGERDHENRHRYRQLMGFLFLPEAPLGQLQIGVLGNLCGFACEQQSARRLFREKKYPKTFPGVAGLDLKQPGTRFDRSMGVQCIMMLMVGFPQVFPFWNLLVRMGVGCRSPNDLASSGARCYAGRPSMTWFRFVTTLSCRACSCDAEDR